METAARSRGLRSFTTPVVPLAWTYAALRTIAPGAGWAFRAFGYCPSCGRQSMIVLAERHADWVRRIAAQWDHGAEYKRELAIRESNICALCRANLRMRAQARAVLDALGLRRTDELAARLAADSSFVVFEAATNTVFRTPAVVSAPNYIASEFRDSAPRGAVVDGVMNQDLQALTFADESVDVILTSDVLEHVVDLDAAIAEIARVLKRGGVHVFTIPHDPHQPHTIERARVEQGTIIHERPAVYHGDSIRGQGILAFRDFGADAAERISRPKAVCREVFVGLPDARAASVFIARKSS